jgi:hypothetical protein
MKGGGTPSFHQKGKTSIGREKGFQSRLQYLIALKICYQLLKYHPNGYKYVLMQFLYIERVYHLVFVDKICKG